MVMTMLKSVSLKRTRTYTTLLVYLCRYEGFIRIKWNQTTRLEIGTIDIYYEWIAINLHSKYSMPLNDVKNFDMFSYICFNMTDVELDESLFIRSIVNMTINFTSKNEYLTSGQTKVGTIQKTIN